MSTIKAAMLACVRVPVPTLPAAWLRARWTQADAPSLGELDAHALSDIGLWPEMVRGRENRAVSALRVAICAGGNAGY
ncbi:hypothetical protein [Falsiroseomonas oryzae]|uniref:hypothetical protein n=1 Tax=Falsiroseomonas oryzae TaxID=2766473 RepID=UPI0022EB01E8|nr:hypothetical protein [Roseomonas sp. MO-31]